MVNKGYLSVFFAILLLSLVANAVNTALDNAKLAQSSETLDECQDYLYEVEKSAIYGSKPNYYVQELFRRNPVDNLDDCTLLATKVFRALAHSW